MTNFRIQDMETEKEAQLVARALNWLPSYGTFFADKCKVMLTSEKKKLSLANCERLTAVIVGIRLAIKDHSWHQGGD